MVRTILLFLRSYILKGINAIAGTHSVLEMSLVFVFLFATGKIFHDAMSVRTALVILLASIGLAYNF